MRDLTSFPLIAAESAGRLLLMWSWQVLLLLGPLLLVVRLYPSRFTEVRYKVCLLGLVAVASLPALTALAQLIPLPSPLSVTIIDVVQNPGIDALAPAAQDDAASQLSSPDGIRLPWLLTFVAWLGGMLVSAKRFVISYRKLHDLRAGARRISFEDLGSAQIDWGLMAPQSVRFGLSPSVQSPSLVGFFRPMIVLPADIADWASAEERAAMLQHELIHLQRMDHYVGYFQALLTSIFFFHPLVRYASYRLSIERELICDEHVLRTHVAAPVYMESLLKVAERNVSNAGIHQPAFFSSRKALERRIKMIIDHDQMPRRERRWPFLILPVGLVLACLCLMVPERRVLARYEPESAQQPEKTEANISEVEIFTDTEVNIENADEWPVIITDARLKLIPPQLIQRVEGQQADGTAEKHCALPTIMLRNVGSKPVSNLVVAFYREQREIASLHFKAEMQPGGSFTLRQDPSTILNTGHLIGMFLRDGADNLTVKVRGVSFDDGSSWGTPTPTYQPSRGKPPIVRAGVLNGKARSKPAPEYPAEARAQNISGTVVVKVVVDEAGKVISAEATSGPSVLREAAVRAAYKAEFSPTRLSGVPVKITGMLTYNFVLR
jgi:TonB family protein